MFITAFIVTQDLKSHTLHIIFLIFSRLNNIKLYHNIT